MMSRNSGSAKPVWSTCRERQVSTCSSRVSAALPQIPSAPMHLEKDTIREIQLEEQLRILLQDCQALDVPQI